MESDIYARTFEFNPDQIMFSGAQFAKIYINM